MAAVKKGAKKALE
jgi:hypothetical protein